MNWSVRRGCTFQGHAGWLALFPLLSWSPLESHGFPFLTKSAPSVLFPLTNPLNLWFVFFSLTNNSNLFLLESPKQGGCRCPGRLCQRCDSLVFIELFSPILISYQGKKRMSQLNVLLLDVFFEANELMYKLRIYVTLCNVINSVCRGFYSTICHMVHRNKFRP